MTGERYEHEAIVLRRDPDIEGVRGVRMSWNQPQCEACWIEYNTHTEEILVGGVPLNQVTHVTTPYRAPNPTLEQCAFCGRPTIVGIFVRWDPDNIAVQFPRAALVDEPTPEWLEHEL